MQLENIINRLNDYWDVLKVRRRILLAAGFLLGLFLGTIAFFSTKYYTANATFHPSIEQSQSPSSFLDNPIAMLLSGRTDGGEIGLMLGVLRSKHLSYEVMRDSVFIDGEQQLMADAVKTRLPKSFSPVGFVIGLVTSLFLGDEEPPTLEKKVINIGNAVRENLTTELSEDGFITLTLTFPDREMVRLISERYLERLEVYYKNQRTEKARQNLAFFTHRTDSVEQEVLTAAYRVARFEETSKFRVKPSLELEVIEERANLEMLQQMWASLVINREQAVAQLQKKTPVIQILDPPGPPYKMKKKSTLVNLIIGGFLGVFLLSLFYTRNMVKEDLIAIIKSQLLSQNTENSASPPESTNPA